MRYSFPGTAALAVTVPSLRNSGHDGDEPPRCCFQQSAAKRPDATQK
jgi:hypothetical protein